MVEYIDGLAWAAINVCYLQYPAGHVASYYNMGTMMLISCVLAVMMPASKP